MPIRLCELCRRKPAELTMCRVSKAGRRAERSLCVSCARDSERILFGDCGMLLTELLETGGAVGEQNRTKVCPSCGNTVDNVRQTGMLGCSMCYVVFREDIDHVINEMHG